MYIVIADKKTEQIINGVYLPAGATAQEVEEIRSRLSKQVNKKTYLKIIKK